MREIRREQIDRAKPSQNRMPMARHFLHIIRGWKRRTSSEGCPRLLNLERSSRNVARHRPVPQFTITAAD